MDGLVPEPPSRSCQIPSNGADQDPERSSLPHPPRFHEIEASGPEAANQPWPEAKESRDTAGMSPTTRNRRIRKSALKVQRYAERPARTETALHLQV